MTRPLLLALALAACCGNARAAMPDAPACLGPAVAFAPGVISTPGLHEGRIAFTPSRDRIYWHVNEIPGPPGSDALYTIMTAARTATGWSQPEVASFSGWGNYADSDPFVSVDGGSLVFSSNRPGNLGAYPLNDIWITRRTADGWGEPVNFGPNVNSPYNELYGSMDAKGNLFFASDRDHGQWDIYRSARRADGSYAPAQPVGRAINHPHLWEFNPQISPDGTRLLYASYGRNDSLGDVDIYFSRLQGDGTWSRPVNVGSCVNSAAPEFHPSMSWDEDLLYFVRGNQTLDFMVAPIRLP